MKIMAGVKAGESGDLIAFDCTRNGKETTAQSRACGAAMAARAGLELEDRANMVGPLVSEGERRKVVAVGACAARPRGLARTQGKKKNAVGRERNWAQSEIQIFI